MSRALALAATILVSLGAAGTARAMPPSFLSGTVAGAVRSMPSTLPSGAVTGAVRSVPPAWPSGARAGDARGMPTTWPSGAVTGAARSVRSTVPSGAVTGAARSVRSTVPSGAVSGAVRLVPSTLPSGAVSGAVRLVPSTLPSGAATGAARVTQPTLPSGAPTAPSAARSWADAQIRAVTAVGILGTDPAAFRPSDPLTRGELADALAAWGKPAAVPADPTRLVTMSELDAKLVEALGLTPAARRIRVAARDAQLAPPSRLGTETVARLLGLRLNHPQGSDNLELGPTQPATRAEAAYSLARALSLTPGQITYLDGLSLTFSPPELDDWQRAVLSRAVRFVGYPYVFSGTSEVTQKLWSATAPGGFVAAPGGFDCSGFVWRVYKTKPFPGAPLLGDILQGRTTYAMSAEVKKPARIALADLEPGDVIFFGSRGPLSSPLEVGHTGIYVGNGWFVHSSEAGVTLQPLAGWYTTRFAWARRPLLEAGLTA